MGRQAIYIPYFCGDSGATALKRNLHRRCYHHIEVRPESIGRVLGTGLRVAGRMAGQRIMGEGDSIPDSRAANQAQPAVPVAAARGRAAGQTTRGVAHGIGGFLRPFQKVGGKIWLEVTGVFFFLPVLVCVPILWRTRFSYAAGPDHRTFWASVIMTGLFSYLGVTSFWRAQKK
jgi:hypothetical protein